jgi:hypothetical protein
MDDLKTKRSSDGKDYLKGMKIKIKRHLSEEKED